MENATLFCVGTVRGVRTAAICTVDGSPFKWEEGDYDPHGQVVADGKSNMIDVGLKVAKRVMQETKENSLANAQVEGSLSNNQIFPIEQQKEHIKTFKDANLYDFIMEIDSLKIEQKAKIFQLTQKKFESNLQFYLENATTLKEDQIEKIIILFYKVQKNLDKGFEASTKEICEANKESSGPIN